MSVEVSLSDEPRDGEYVSDVTLRKMISEYYVDQPVGGNAHVVFDEGGATDEVIMFCVYQAFANGDWICCGLLMELFKRHPLFRKEIVKWAQ